MFLAYAFSAAPGTTPDLRWWFGHAASTPAALRARLTAGLPVRTFDPHSASHPEDERERVYDFLHDAELHGQQLVAYSIEPGTEIEQLDEATLERIPVEYVLNSLRSMEITSYQVKHHDRGADDSYDPEGYADELAKKRAARWKQNRAP